VRASKPPVAVLCDMDGTLVDTEPYWMAAETALVESHGGTWTTADAEHLVGSELSVSARYLREVGGVRLEPAEIVEHLLDDVVARILHEVPWRPGALELLADLGAAGVPCALVTMSYRRFAQPVLDALPPETFQVIVTGDAVTQGKPHPEPYLKACALLGVDAPETVAIEDSNTGARSAEAAGCCVIVVPNHVPVLESEARVFAETLPRSWAALQELLRPGLDPRIEA
jgi:HAD superfamily hydrolase (TIGR01509 family)